MKKKGFLKRNGSSGQVVVEFAAMLVIAVILGLALLALGGGIAEDGDRKVEIVRFDVP